MPKWRPKCFGGSIHGQGQEEAPPRARVSLAEIFPGQEIPPESKGVFFVELQKKEGFSLGLTVAGGVDKGERPQVSNLRPGTTAYRCDALLVGDFLVSVNDIRTSNLRHEEVINLLKNAGTNVSLQIEYPMPELDTGRGSNIQTKCQEVILDKEPSGFGFTMRGGMLLEHMRAYPLSVVAIRPGGPADREGSIKAGDRILAINGYKVTHLSLGETMTVMRQCEATASFTVAYDTAIMEAVEKASGPVLLEIDHNPVSGLGINLTSVFYEGKSRLCVDFVKPMGIADRSGALHQGDYILSIDGVDVESMSVPEASQLLKSSMEASVQLEIVPATHLELCANREILDHNGINGNVYANINSATKNTSGSLSQVASIGLNQFGTLNMRKRNTWSNGVGRRATSCLSIASSAGTSVLSATNQVCHTETMEVILFSDHRGLGMALKGGVISSAPLSQPPTIACIEPRSAAERCGVLQEGDRVLAIDGVETVERPLDELHHFLCTPRSRCVLLVEFDVTESVVLSSGTYIVKLAKHCNDTGITVHASKSNQDQNNVLFISDVRRGSVAHRSGSVQAGDKLIAINDVRLDSCTYEDAMHLLELPDEIVKLKLRRDDPDEGHEGCVIYTVELQRFGGALGITVSGTEDPHDPIVISELSPQGLAERTGAIHLGDWLLAVSGDTTKNKPLSEVIRMLQSAGDIVTLKIARPERKGVNDLQTRSSNWGNASKTSTPLPSVDSAMESMDSSAIDLANGTLNGHSSAKKGLGSQTLGGNNAVINLAVPQGAKLVEETQPNSASHDQLQDSSKSNPEEDMNRSVPSSYRENDDMSSQTDDFDDDDDDDDDDDRDSTSTNIEEWVKTLEEFDTESGSEMLRQIGLSLRQRSTLHLDHPSNDPIIHLKQGPSSKSVSRLSKDLQKHGSLQDVEAKDIKRHEKNKSSVDIYNSPQRLTKTTAVQDVYAVPNKSKTSTLPNLPPRSNGTNSNHHQNQVKTIFTPSPVQFQRAVLQKCKSKEDFGFSLSDGLYETGVYISAVRKSSLAEEAGLRIYDKILQVNKQKMHDRDCSHIVPLIAAEGKRLSIIVCRNPLLRLTNSVKDESVKNHPSRKKS